MSGLRILQPKRSIGQFPILLGRPWIATANAYIALRSGKMLISRGEEQKSVYICPPAHPETAKEGMAKDILRGRNTGFFTI